jgi:hypothetical protein
LPLIRARRLPFVRNPGTIRLAHALRSLSGRHALIARFEPRIADPVVFARANRVLLLRASSGVGLDIAFGGLPFEEEAVNRSSLFTFPPDVPLRTCSDEDLVVFKAFADRPPMRSGPRRGNP